MPYRLKHAVARSWDIGYYAVCQANEPDEELVAEGVTCEKCLDILRQAERIRQNMRRNNG